MTWHTVETWSGTMAVPAPFDWSPILHLIRDLVVYSSMFTALFSKVLDFLRWLRWIMKHRKSRTPVVLHDLLSETG